MVFIRSNPSVSFPLSSHQPPLLPKITQERHSKPAPHRSAARSQERDQKTHKKGNTSYCGWRKRGRRKGALKLWASRYDFGNHTAPDQSWRKEIYLLKPHEEFLLPATEKILFVFVVFVNKSTHEPPHKFYWNLQEVIFTVNFTYIKIWFVVDTDPRHTG